MSRFYGFDNFPPEWSPACRRYWMREGTRLLRIRERIEAGIDDDNELYKAMMEYAGEDAAREAYYHRKKSRRDAQVKSEA